MSRSRAIRLRANLPAADNSKRFERDVLQWMRHVTETFNRFVEAQAKDRSTFATVVPIIDKTTGVQTAIYYLVNAYYGPDSQFRLGDKAKPAWAFRFDLTDDKFDLLHCDDGIDPISWTSYLSVSSTGAATISAYAHAIRTVTTNYTIVSADEYVFADATSGALTVSLPAVAGYTGRVFEVKKIDSSANLVTVDPNGAETIDGAATRVLATQYEAVQFISNGSAWFIV